MSNTAWVKGQPSPNPHGRPKKKRSSPSIARMIERFVMRNVSPRKLQKLFDGLKPNEKMTFLSDLLPYAISKKPTQAQISIDNLTDQQLNDLYDSVMTGIMLPQESITGPLLNDIPEAEIIPTDGQRSEN